MIYSDGRIIDLRDRAWRHDRDRRARSPWVHERGVSNVPPRLDLSGGIGGRFSRPLGGRGITSASTARHPRSADQGVRVEAVDVLAKVVRERRKDTRARARASRSTGGCPRTPSSSGRVSSRSIGARARVDIQRWQRHAPVLHHLDENATRPHQHQRPELRIPYDPERDLDARRRHRRDTVTRGPSRRSRSVYASSSDGESSTPSRTPPTSDLCCTPGRRRLDGDREPEPFGRGDRVLERVGANALDHRHAVVGEQREPLELVERLAARQPVEPPLPDLVGHR